MNGNNEIFRKLFSFDIARKSLPLYIWTYIYLYNSLSLFFFFRNISRNIGLCNHVKEEGDPTTFDYTTYITVIVKRTVVVRAKHGEWKP